MKKLSIYSGLFMLSMSLFTACSSEDIPTAGQAYKNPFDIAADETDPELVLRREFHEKNGVYLVLGDNVGSGVLPDGTVFDESIDLAWSLFGDRIPYNITYFNSLENKKKASELLEKYILPHFSGSSRPYSILPVENYMNNNSRKYYILTNIRCMLLNMGDVVASDEDELQDNVEYLLSNIVTQLLDDADSELKEPFYNFSNDYYDQYIIDIVPEWSDDQNIEYIYELGFLKYDEDWWEGDPDYDQIRYYLSDFRDFRDLVINNTQEEVYETYGDYPLIIQKYELMKSIIAKVGYTL